MERYNFFFEICICIRNYVCIQISVQFDHPPKNILNWKNDKKNTMFTLNFKTPTTRLSSQEYHKNMIDKSLRTLYLFNVRQGYFISNDTY